MADSGFIRRYPNSDISVQWTPEGSGGGAIDLGSKWPLPCFTLGGGGNYTYVNKVRPGGGVVEGEPNDGTWNYDDSGWVTGENGDMDIYDITPFNFDPATQMGNNFQIFVRGESSVDEDYFEVYLRVNGTNYMVEDTYAFYTGGPSDVSFYSNVNPATSELWTIADLNGTGDNPLQGIGIKNIGTGTMKVYGMWLEVETYYETTVTVIADTSVQWTPSEGSDNYAMVDKTDTTSPPSTTTYNQCSSAEGSPKIDKFTFTGFSIPSNAKFDYLYYGLYFHTYAESHGGLNGLKLNGWIGGTKYQSDELDPDYTWDWWPFQQPFVGIDYNVNPKTSSQWVYDDLNGTGSNPLTHIGYEDVFINGDGGVRIAQIAATVRYRRSL